MKVNFTKREYRTLIDLVQIAECVLFCYQFDNDEELRPHKQLIQKIFALNKEMGAENLIEYDSQMNEYFPSQEYDEEISKLMEPYEDNFFWEELSFRLAKRDLIDQAGVEQFKQMSPEQRAHKLFELEEPYAEEFQTNGIQNLRIRQETVRE